MRAFPAGLQLLMVWLLLLTCTDKTGAAANFNLLKPVALVLIAPPDITVQCNAIPAPQLPTVHSSCIPVPVPTLTEVITNRQCENSYDLLRIWRAVEVCGGVAQDTQVVHVIDTEVPKLCFMHPLTKNLKDGDTLVIECDQDPKFQDSDVWGWDNCDKEVEVRFEDFFVDLGDCQVDKFWTLSYCGWIGADNCGNSDTLHIYVKMIDTTPPKFGPMPDTIRISCDQLNGLKVRVTDNCASYLYINHKDDITPFGCEITIRRTWLVNDECGNLASRDQVILARDTTPPVFINLPRDTVLTCDAAIPAASSVRARDNCTPFVSVRFRENISLSGCQRRIERIWEAKDDCGNTATGRQVILQNDNTGPIVTNAAPTHVVVSCDSLFNVPAPVFSDVCSIVDTVLFGETTLHTPCGSLIERTWTARDSCGNSTIFTQNIQITDRTTPGLIGVPADLTLECGDQLPTWQVTAVDNCDTSLIVVFSENVAGEPCAGEQVVRTWTVADDCGNTASATQLITIFDTQAPTLIGVPQDLHVSCNDIPSVPVVTAVDICDPDLVVHFHEIHTGDLCNSLQIHRIWSVADRCGNLAEATQVITVRDTTAPALVGVPADVASSCEDLPPVPVVTATDDCDSSVLVTLSETQIGTNCNRTIRRTWTATDDCGNRTTATQLITAVDTVAPLLRFTDPLLTRRASGDTLTLECDYPFVFSGLSVSGTDNCDDNVSVAMNSDVSHGDCLAVGFQQFIHFAWVGSDNCGNQASLEIFVKIVDTRPPVLLNVPDDISLPCDAPIPPAPSVAAFDNCDSLVAVSFTERFARIACQLDILREWTATDKCGNRTTESQKIFLIDQLPPEVIAPLPDLTINCDEPLPTDQPTFSDYCDDTLLIFVASSIIPDSCGHIIETTWTAVDDCNNSVSTSRRIRQIDRSAPRVVRSLPDVTIDCYDPHPTDTPEFSDDCDLQLDIMVISTILPDTCGYHVLASWTATDDCGNSVSTSRTIRVLDTEEPVFLHIPADTIVACDQIPLPGNVAATDNCDPDVEIHFAERRTGSNALCNEVIERTWTAIDNCGNRATATQHIRLLDDEAPLLSLVQPQLLGLHHGDTLWVPCNQFSQFDSSAVRAIDNCSASLSVSYFSTFLGSQACTTGSLGLWRLTWTAVDNCGNSTQLSIFIALVDTRPPVIGGVPANLHLQCGNPIPAPPVLQAIDDCDPSVDVHFAERLIPGICAGNYQILRTWTATDDCGNTATATQVVLIQDSTPPVVHFNHPALTGKSNGDTLFMSCDSLIFLGAGDVLASDNCGDVDVRFIEDIRESTDCAQDGYLTRLHCTWRATDDCGNSSEIFIVVLVGDRTPPVFRNAFRDLHLSCDEAIPDTSAVLVLDNCNLGVHVDFHEVRIPGSCVGQFQVVRTWIASDVCGNKSTRTQTISVRDTIAPRVIGVGADTTISCNQSVGLPTVTALDNCDPAPNLVFSEQRIAGSCLSNYTLLRTWRATDACGNARNATQRIEVRDTQPPVVTMNLPVYGSYTDGDTLFMDCDRLINLDDMSVRASDNCTGRVRVEFFVPEETYGDCARVGYLLKLVCLWIATDACDNSTAFTLVVYVVDRKAPVLQGVPANLQLDCGATPPPPALVTAIDNCSSPVAVAFREENIAGNCPGTRDIHRTWEATDDCGNKITGRQVITITDTLAPIFLNIPRDTIVTCSTLPPVPTLNDLQPRDNCDPHPQVNFAERPSGSTCDDRILLRTWTLTDACGNERFYRQNIGFRDVEAPVFLTLPRDTTVPCDHVPTPAAVEANDFCEGRVPVAYLETFVAGNCISSYQLVRRWTATDLCGNSATITQTLTVVDLEAPVIAPLVIPGLGTFVNGDTIYIECDALTPMDENSVQISDNCDATPSVEFIEHIQTASDCKAGGYISHMDCAWVATDDCRNSDTLRVQIFIVDAQEPVLAGVTPNLALNLRDGMQIPPPPLVTATDNCTDSLVVQFGESRTTDPCGFTLVRTWTVEDPCGNVAAASQTIRADAEVVVASVNKLDADCGLANGSAEIMVMGNVAAHSFLWIPDVGAGVANSRTGLPAGDYNVLVYLDSFPACGQVVYFKIGDDCPPLQRDTLHITLKNTITTVCFDSTVLENLAPLASAGICESGNPATVEATSIQGNCVTLRVGHGFIGVSPDTICVVHCYQHSYCDTTLLIVEMKAAPLVPCIEPVNIFDDDVLRLATNNCASPSMVCLGLAPEKAKDYLFSLYGFPYGIDPIPCSFEEVMSYPVFSLPGNGKVGPYQLLAWAVDGLNFEGQFATMAELVNAMNSWDQAGLWSLDSKGESIIGGAANKAYGQMIFKQENSGITTYLQPVIHHRPVEVGLPLHPGIYQIKAEERATGCRDTMDVGVYCITTEILRLELEEFSVDTLRVDFSQLPGAVRQLICSWESRPSEYVDLKWLPSAKAFLCNAKTAGQDNLDVVALDEWGLVDTTLLQFVVRKKQPQDPPPLEIHTGFSPNDDGVNDIFHIENIEYYPGNSLRVFNRWGTMVFTMDDYLNTWNGTWNDTHLPDGTYFYWLDDGRGKTYSGYVQIHK
jgi:gliding motility-associated-like protein